MDGRQDKSSWKSAHRNRVYQTTASPVLTKLEEQENKTTLEQRESCHFIHLFTSKSIKELLLVKLELDFQYCPLIKDSLTFELRSDLLSTLSTISSNYPNSNHFNKLQKTMMTCHSQEDSCVRLNSQNPIPSRFYSVAALSRLFFFSSNGELSSGLLCLPLHLSNLSFKWRAQQNELHTLSQDYRNRWLRDPEDTVTSSPSSHMSKEVLISSLTEDILLSAWQKGFKS